MRSSPNIIVTGTPGVGKTSHCEVLARDHGLKHISINEMVKRGECQAEWDDEMESWIVDEDSVSLALPLSGFYPQSLIPRAT